jgi:hypothetical protein
MFKSYNLINDYRLHYDTASIINFISISNQVQIMGSVFGLFDVKYDVFIFCDIIITKDMLKMTEQFISK